MNLRWQQIAGLAGIIFAVLNVIGGLVLVPQPPMVDDSVSKIVSYYADHQTGLLVQTYVFGISWVVFAVFLGGVRRTLRGADMWAGLTLIGAVAWLALNMVSQGIIAGLAARIAKHFPAAATMVGLHDATVMLFALSFFGIAGMLTGVSKGARETGAFGGWHGWFGYAIAAFALVTSLAIV
jgi:hypothetical protein